MFGNFGYFNNPFGVCSMPWFTSRQMFGFYPELNMFPPFSMPFFMGMHNTFFNPLMAGLNSPNIFMPYPFNNNAIIPSLFEIQNINHSCPERSVQSSDGRGSTSSEKNGQTSVSAGTGSTARPKRTTSKQPSISTSKADNNPKVRHTTSTESDFTARVKEVANRINCDYRDLLAVMRAESGINPQAVNSKSGATGLIQFMPKTAEMLGTTTHALKNMNAIEQMEYVEKYLVNAKRNAGFNPQDRLSGGELYALIFLPARSKRDVLCTEDENYYKWNKGLDINHDGKITKAELNKRVEKFQCIA